MEEFILFEKLPKKKQREMNRAKRGCWYGLNPVTRKPENSKAYNRRKAQKWSSGSDSVPFAIPEMNDGKLIKFRRHGHWVYGM